MRRADLLTQAARAVDQVGPFAAPPSARAQLGALCATVRVALGAAACSVARLDGDHLVFEAADGEGSVVGLRLPVTRGIAGYVARTGQAMAIDQVQADPRFARAVAEQTGYLPTSLLVVPVMGERGDMLGVLSVLDRTATGAEPLAVATSAAAQAALVLPSVDAVARFGPLVFAAFADAVAAGDPNLAAALRRAADRETAGADDPDDFDDPPLGRVAALLAELAAAGPATIAAAERILTELTTVARIRRPRPSSRPAANRV
jgi:hypothetical protein